MEIGKETVGASFSLIYINKTPGLDISAVLMEESPQRSFKGHQRATGFLFALGNLPLGSCQRMQGKTWCKGTISPHEFLNGSEARRRHGTG